MAQTKCLFLTGSFILLLATGLSHAQGNVGSPTSFSSSSTSPSLRNVGYFNGSSLVTISNSSWDLRSTKEITLRTCHPDGMLLSQDSSHSSGLTHLSILLHNGTIKFRWRVTSLDSSGQSQTQNMSVSVGEGLSNNQQYTVRLKYYLGKIYLNVSVLNQTLNGVIFSRVVASDRLHRYLMRAAIRFTDLRVGFGFVGCMYGGPGVDFRQDNVLVDSVVWNACALEKKPGCSQTDGNDCYLQPCQNGGRCIDMFQTYRCACPRNFNGTNCEQDLARELGCAVSPCENNATCEPLSVSPLGARPYRCNCTEGFTGVNCEILLNQCEMKPSPCEFGVCTSDVNSYHCNCTGTGFRGRNCSEDIDECLEENVCGTGKCFNRRGNFSCECPPGYDGPRCEDINECLSAPCQNNATCHQGIDNYTCDCLPDFEGVNCEHRINNCVNVTCSQSNTQCEDGVLDYSCVCLPGYRNVSGVCEEIDECALNPCMNNATCKDRVNNYTCDCAPGYTGHNCETDIDECEVQPCQNNATCQDGINMFTCQCAPGYTDHTCATDIDDCVNHACQHGATCLDLVNDYRCECVEGWAGPTCGDNIDDCASGPCLNNARCNDRVANYTCTCLPGFTGYHCETNINDCDPDPCLNSATCVDRVADYDCNCPPQWMGKNCSENYDACSFLPCENGATCSTTIPNRGYNCSCVTGFEGVNCENNIDDCLGVACRSFEKCYDLINNYTCACPIGYEGDECQTEINECASNPCQNGGECHDHIGFYNCSCKQYYTNQYNYPTGYTGENCEKDINECGYYPPICQNGGTCENLNGSYQCRCVGQKPNGDLVTGLNCQLVTSYCLASGNPCKNGATCVNAFGTYACDCVPGFADKNCSTNINECESNPCQYNGTCTDGINGYNCTCIPGITGSNCEENIDDCQGDPCGPGTCQDLINDYQCNCTDTGFKGDNCEINIDDCREGICQHNGTCVDGIKNYTCNCLEAYTGAECETDIPECEATPCQYNGTCLEYSDQSLYGQGRPEFSHFSYATAAGYLCVCIEGIEGENCSINIDDCESQPCQNNATCQDGINRFYCRCVPGYEGLHCETEINECTRYQPCLNGATCTDLVADYSCQCLDFSPSRQNYGGKNCSVYLSGCDNGADDNCQHGQCVPILVSEQPVQHGYTCRCDAGFTGQRCDISTTVTFSSNGSLITYTPVGTINEVLSFRFRTTLSNTVLALYDFSLGASVWVEISQGKLMVAYRDALYEYQHDVDSQGHVNNANWHHVYLHLHHNVSLTLVSDACGTEQCVQQFDYPQSKPQSSAPQVYFGNLPTTQLTQTLSSSMFVGCLEDVIFDGVYLYPGQQEGKYTNMTRNCPRSVQCDPYTCSRHGTCEDLWDRFRCHCDRPYWGRNCEHEYTAATFFKDGIPSIAKFPLDSLAHTFSNGLDLSLFLQTRQEDSIIMYLTNESAPSDSPITLTLEMQNGRLATRLNLCGAENYFTEEKGLIDFGSLNFIHLTFKHNTLLLRVNETLCINQSLSELPCTLGGSSVYFGKVPDVSVGRRRRQAMTSPPPLTNLNAFNGILKNVELQDYNLEFEERNAPEETNVVLMSAESNVTLGAVSTVSICNTSQPCENNGTCSDLFYNDFECQCTEGYLGKNCSRPDFCKDNSCPPGSHCMSLQVGFECISKATFDGIRSVATYTDTLSGSLPSERISFKMRTRSFYGAIFEVHAPLEQNNFIKIRIRGGKLEVNYLLESNGFSSSLKLNEPINDGQWYFVEIDIHNENSMSMKISLNGTIMAEAKDNPLGSPTTSLTSLVLDGTIQVGDTADSKEQMFKGCLEELRVGGILLPFIFDSSMTGNTAQLKFSATSLSGVQPGCAGSDACAGNACLEEDTCRDVWNDYVCDCGVGYEGRYCHLEVDECLAGPCLNGAVCVDGVGNYTCVCPLGFSGARCENAFNACGNNSCANNSTCTVNPNVSRGYVCNCADSNYSGDLCNINIENKSCADNLCQNPGSCTDDLNSSSFTCTCAPGFTGSLCESPINYCVDLPCNNGTCRSNASMQNFTCECAQGFTGDVCETNIDDCTPDSCYNGGTCVDGINHHSCICPQGFSGQWCQENVNQCDNNMCQHGVCREITDEPGYECDCSNTGYTGVGCQSELNECSHNFCQPQTSLNCTNLEGDYECDCKLGFTGKNCSVVACDDGQCKSGSTCKVVTADWDPTATDWACDCLQFYGGKQCDKAGPCVAAPCNSSNTDRCEQSDEVFTSNDTDVTSNFTCHCNTGWEGALCSDDIDECSPNPCQYGAVCRNLPGSFKCDCTLGYTGVYCGTDINECDSVPCLNAGFCIDNIGSFTCNCTGTGYEGNTCQDDVNECEQDLPCENNNTCVNKDGTFECECEDQYLGDRCQHGNPCTTNLCANGGTCNHTWQAGQGIYIAQCTCADGYQGSRCEQSPQTGDDGINIAAIIGPVVGVILLIIIIVVIIFVMVARNKRATHGAYSPSRQETAGARVELGNVLKKPPEERLI